MTKIIILGGGFGGIRCALDLEKKMDSASVKITLIDRNSYHLFLPSIYEVASAYGVKKDPFAIRLRKTICIPYVDIFAGKNIDFVEAEIKAVDLNSRKIKTKGGAELEYDYLVIALGSQTADFGIPGVNEYAYQFKSLDDVLAVNKKLDDLVNKMAKEKTSPARILVGGAGFTGIELAAELACCTKKMGRSCGMKGRCSMITLVEAGPKILPMISEKQRKKVLKQLTKLGIVVMENSAIEEVGPKFLKLKNGRELDGDMIIWTAGIKANEFLKLISGLPLNDKGKIVVTQDLEVQGLTNVFAIGDNIEFIDPKNQKSVPGLAYVAIDQGKTAARNISNSINGKKPKPYNPSFDTWIAPVGGKFALAHLWGRLTVTGFWGWFIRETVDLRYFFSILSISRAISLFWQDIIMFTKND